MTAATLDLLPLAGNVALTLGIIAGLGAAFARQSAPRRPGCGAARLALLAGGVFTVTVLAEKSARPLQPPALGVPGLLALAAFAVALVETARHAPALRTRIGGAVFLLIAGALALAVSRAIGGDAGPISG